ncbi:MAG: ATP-binding cassette domain-containing protein [Clostridium sp.]|nr:ATP-binding cassette domain-containing protein [Clostridium sp.]
MFEISGPDLATNGVRLRVDHPFTIRRGITVVIGPNGAGKSVFGRILSKGRNYGINRIAGLTSKDLVFYLEFADIHSLTGVSVENRQQRYEASANDLVPTVADIAGSLVDSPLWSRLADLLGFRDYRDKKLNFLSSGELRKFLLINALVRDPGLLILDNPFIGLDADARRSLGQAITSLRNQGSAVMLLVCDPADIPDCTDTLIPMPGGLTIGEPIDAASVGIDRLRHTAATLFPPRPDIDPDNLFDSRETGDAHKVVVEMHDCRVDTVDRHILGPVSWRVCRGEIHALSGPNGSGKSTLLSLLYGDHPQAYANDVSLFGRRRGSGESIWDVKKRIGYLSSESHLYFRAGTQSGLEVVARGFLDTPGCFVRVSDEFRETARRWLAALELEELTDRPFRTLSAGEQRLLLLVRAMVKNPELLILDEPMHGLDPGRKRQMLRLIETLCRSQSTAVIYVTHCPSELPGGITGTLRLTDT